MADSSKKLLNEILGKAAELSSLMGDSGEKSNKTSSSSSSSSQPLPRRLQQPARFQRTFGLSTIPKRARAKSVVSGRFLRDIVLLPCPDISVVPRQARKVWLVENGYLISAFEFFKEWPEHEVEIKIKEAFSDKIPSDVDIELLMPVHTSLVKPTLAQGQPLNGLMLHKIFKEKPVYVLPSRDINEDNPFNGKEPDSKKIKIDANLFNDDHVCDNNDDDDTLCQMLDFIEKQPCSAAASNPLSTSRRKISSTSTRTQPTTTSTSKPSSASYESQSTSSSSANEASMKSPSSSGRVTCDKCSCTYVFGEECLRCLQDAEYEKSLCIDKQKESEVMSGPSKSPIVDEVPEEVDLEELRGHRLARLMDNTQDIPPPDTPPAETEKCEIELEVHRTTIKKDLMREFADPSIIDKEINFRLIDERGKVEAGLGTGVTREVYSLFWSDFAISMTIGERERVPFVRHDHFLEEYDAIGRILVKGFISVGYFPIFIAKAFICFCLFGASVTDDIFMNSFKRFLSQSEEDLIENVLKSDALPDDEFIEFLDRFNCRSAINKENVEKVLIEIAKQELISKPHMMMAAWQQLLQQFLKPYAQFRSIAAVMNMYDEYSPTPKKVLNNLSCNPQTNAEKDAFKYLQRYIRGLDSNNLSKFLKFTTGMDIMGRDKIKVSFLSTTGFSSRPIAHTCAPLLELPSTYNNFVELREEFQNILNQNISWDIDIV